MRNLLAFLAAAALTVAGLGWYLDWYRFQSTPTSDGHRSITVDIDGKKIGDDVRKGAERGAAKVHDALERRHGDQSPSTSGKEDPRTAAPPPAFPPPPENDEPSSDRGVVP